MASYSNTTLFKVCVVLFLKNIPETLRFAENILKVNCVFHSSVLVVFEIFYVPITIRRTSLEIRPETSVDLRVSQSSDPMEIGKARQRYKVYNDQYQI